MCGHRRNACHSRRNNMYNNGYYQPRRQGFLRTIITQALEKREREKMWMAQPQTEAAWEPKEMAVGSQKNGVVGWADEKQDLRLEEVGANGKNRRIDVEGLPSYREVMKSA